MPLIERFIRSPCWSEPFFEVRGKEPADYWSAGSIVPSHVRTIILMRKIFKSQAKGKRWTRPNNTLKFVEKRRLAVCRQAHDLVFVAEFPEAEILSECCVIHSQRMGERHFAKRAYSWSFAHAAHEICEVAQTVRGEHGCPIKW